MKAYLDIVHQVYDEGEIKVGRNGSTISLSGTQFRHDMRKGFPILTIREMSLKAAITELRFFIQGFTDKSWLQMRGNKFWDKWCNVTSEEFMGLVSANIPVNTAARMTTDLGPIYGYQWRKFNGTGIDQLKDVLSLLRTSPNSRRMLVSAWNPLQLASMALPPCHDSFQFISNGKDLDLIWRQRSCDIAIGLPYDILLYGLLLTLVAHDVGMEPRFLTGQFGDTHVYDVNKSKLDSILERNPRILPELHWKHGAHDIFQWAASDELSSQWELEGYKPHPKCFFEVVE